MPLYSNLDLVLSIKICSLNNKILFSLAISISTVHLTKGPEGKPKVVVQLNTNNGCPSI